MRRVVIKISSPEHKNFDSEQDRNLSPSPAMKELHNGSGELQIDKDVQYRAVSPTKIENQSTKVQTAEPVDKIGELTQNSLNELKSSQESFLIQNDQNVPQMRCSMCGHNVDAGEIESKFDANRKELEAKKLEVEDFKTKLEYELFERLKIEEDFSTERDLFEREISTLRERIYELEGEATWKIEDLENDFKVLTTKHENAKEEISHLKIMLERTISENVKLRNNESVTDDRVMEILDELQIWKQKARENAERGDASRSNLQTEIEMYEKEIEALKQTLTEISLSNDTRGRKIHELENSLNCTENAIDDVRDDFENSTHNTNKPNKEIGSSSDKHILELCGELSELYRDNSNYQEKCLSLYEGLRANEKELESVRAEYESQNIEIQNYKEKYAELNDVVLATSQDNSHLKNRLEEKCKDYTDLKKKYIVSNTEVIWLREALGLLKTSTNTV